jgi:hypothetical protein
MFELSRDVTVEDNVHFSDNVQNLLVRHIEAVCRGRDGADDIVSRMGTLVTASIPRNETPGAFLDEVIVKRLADIMDILAQLEAKPHVRSAASEAKTPEPPPDLLSINQMRAIYTALELTWHIGIRPYVYNKMMKSPVSSVSLPKSLLIDPQSLSLLGTLSVNFDVGRVWSYVRCIGRVSGHPLFSSLMLSRQMSRLILALLCLIEEPALGRYTDSDGDSDRIREVSMEASVMLNQLAAAASSKSMFVSELKVASRGPEWMKKAASLILASVIMSEGGVEAVLHGYLQGKM